MTRKKLKFTAALVLIGANLFFGTGVASAESGQMFLNISPMYMHDLWSYLGGFPEDEPDGTEGEEFIHVVARGENLIRIARRYDMDAGVLAAINGIKDPNLILVGQELRVTMPEKITHTLAWGETLIYLSLAYGVDLADLKMANHIVDPASLPVGMVLTIPNPTRFPPSSEPAATVTVASRSGGTTRLSSAPSLVWPLRGTITSRFGVLRSSGYHWGLDIAAASGTPIRAAAGGTVVQAERLGSYGLMVVVDHGNGWSTLYAHASSLLVSTGQRLAKGEKIALVGATGNATGPHLHLEVIYQGKKLNPMTYLP